MAVELVCTACGARADAADRSVAFCPACGAYLAWEAAADGHDVADRPGADPGPPPRSAAFPDDDLASLGAPSAAAAPAPPAVAVLPSPPPAPHAQPRAGAESAGCPGCGSPREPGRRFCPRCGHQLVHPVEDSPLPVTSPPRVPWWRRWLPGKEMRAWRRSLPLRYRVRRLVLAVLALVLVAAGLTVVGRNPVRWAVDRWNDVRDVRVVVGDLTAVGVPAEVAEAPAAAAVDRRLDTAWATGWPDGAVPVAGCAAPRTDADPASPAALLVGLDGPRRVVAVRIHPGPPTAEERAAQPRPRRLTIGSDDACVTVDLADSPEPVTVDLPTTTAALWIAVVDVWPSGAVEPARRVSLTEVELLARP